MDFKSVEESGLSSVVLVRRIVSARYNIELGMLPRSYKS